MENLLDIKKRNLEQIKKLQNINRMIEEELQSNNETIKNGFLFYSLMIGSSAQAKAIPSEQFIIQKMGLTPVDAKENHGDGKDDNNNYYEIKTSFTNSKNYLNIRQIRLYQNNDYYICGFINEDDLDKSKFYLLTEEQMKKEVELCGGFTHGTQTVNEENEHPEYSITIPVYSSRSEKTRRWDEKYLNEEIKNIILH